MNESGSKRFDAESDRAVFEGIKTATVIKPGDQVLLTVSGNWTRAMCDEADRVFAERFPEAEFVIAVGVDEVVVAPRG